MGSVVEGIAGRADLLDGDWVVSAGTIGEATAVEQVVVGGAAAAVVGRDAGKTLRRTDYTCIDGVVGESIGGAGGRSDAVLSHRVYEVVLRGG